MPRTLDTIIFLGSGGGGAVAVYTYLRGHADKGSTGDDFFAHVIPESYLFGLIVAATSPVRGRLGGDRAKRYQRPS
jgi:hypothetical protein